MFTEPTFYRGRHGQESEEGKENRQGSHQEGGKENFKEKEVVVSATERLLSWGRNPDTSKTSPKDTKLPSASRFDKAGPLCKWLLNKGPAFIFLQRGSREGSIDRLLDFLASVRPHLAATASTSLHGILSDLQR
jgi:hypothetical protein